MVVRVISVIAVAMVAAVASAESPLKNPAFESFDKDGRPEGWALPPSHYRVERGAGSNGSGGLVYENETPGDFRERPYQNVDFVSGGVYRFGGWVRASRLIGRGPAFVYVDWFDKDGRYIGESWSTCVRNESADWVKVEGLTSQIPTNAARVRLCVAVGYGRSVGRVAFDQLYFERHVRKPVVAVYCDAYRNEADEGEVAFAAVLTPEAFGVPDGKAEVVFAAKRPDGTTFVLPVERPEPGAARAVVPVERFAPGTNEVVCAVKAAGKVVGRASTSFVRGCRPRKVRLDRYGRTLVDGKPFFPLGMYTSQMSQEAVRLYAESKFNCLMQYGSPSVDQMQMFKSAGIKVIFDIASQYGREDKGTNYVRWAVNKFKDHPALLAWYMFDEQPTSVVPMLEARKRLVDSLDADHPVWCAQDIFSETRHYIGACDVFGGDPYPISSRPISMATDAIRTERKGLMGMRPIWQVAQSFCWAWHNPAERQRRPTEQEIRNMAWQAIAGGANGVIFYSFGYLIREVKGREPVEVLWPELKRVAAEIADREAYLLSVEQPPALPQLPEGVVGRAWRKGERTLRVLVNTTTEMRRVGALALDPLAVRFDE